MIPYLDLKAQYRSIRSELDAAVLGVMERAEYVLGPEVEAFEAAFAAFCGTSYAVGVSSGTAALELALRAAEIGPGDEVITVPATFVATVAAIRQTGARPVFVDIDGDSGTMNVERFEAAITPRTRAVIPVHLYGRPARMPAVLETARRHGVLVIEDAAQAHGAEIAGKRVGGWGDIGCFSCYPGKNLGAYGDAGVVVTSREDLAENLRLLRNWGQRRKGVHDVPGDNARLDGIQAAVLRVKLRHLEGWTRARIEKARRYDDLLADVAIRTPSAVSDGKHVYHVYGIRCAHRKLVQRRLLDRGIQSAIHYEEPVHLSGAHRDLGYREGDFPESEALFQEELSLPLYPELSDVDQQHVAQAVAEAVTVFQKAG